MIPLTEDQIEMIRILDTRLRLAREADEAVARANELAKQRPCPLTN